MARILLVEDEDALRRVMLQLLVMEHHEVTTAADGKAAVRLAEANPFDLVITDLIMPEQEGIETIRELKRKAPEIKIIAMSGGGEGEARDYLTMALMLGASRTLAKPFNRQQLVEAVNSVLNQ